MGGFIATLFERVESWFAVVRGGGDFRDGGGDSGFLKGERVITGTLTGDLTGLRSHGEWGLLDCGGITLRTLTGVTILQGNHVQIQQALKHNIEIHMIVPVRGDYTAVHTV